jgi:hypothetical protein
MPKQPTIIAALALIGFIVSSSREIAFRHGAERDIATVRAWHSNKIGGFAGTAVVDVDSARADPAVKKNFVRTVLWYRPTAGERVEVLRKPGGGQHLASLWQGFGISAICLLLALVAGLWSWRSRDPDAVSSGR